jgi:HPt (histidine-containing phosphotransfer) domain-containing protein
MAPNQSGTGKISASICAYDEADIFDEDVFLNLQNAISSAKLLDLLRSLQKTLELPLAVYQAPSGQGLADLEKRAHRTIASSGFLGFLAFSELCRTLQNQCGPSVSLTPDEFDHLLAILNQMRLRVLEKVQTLIETVVAK